MSLPCGSTNHQVPRGELLHHLPSTVPSLMSPTGSTSSIIYSGVEQKLPRLHLAFTITDVTNFLALGVKKGPEGGHGEERGDTGAEGAAGKRDFGSLTTSVYTSTSLSTSPSQADPGLQYAGPVLSRVVPRNLTSLPCSVIKLSSFSHSNQSPSFDSVSS